MAPKRKPQPPSNVHRLDPHDINSRVQALLDRILTRVEGEGDKISLSDLLKAAVYVSRVQTAFVGLRKEKRDEPSAGARAREYSKAFTTHAARGRKKGPGPAAVPDDDDLDEFDLDAEIGDRA
jgi:hypothetical protein